MGWWLDWHLDWEIKDGFIGEERTENLNVGDFCPGLDAVTVFFIKSSFNSISVHCMMIDYCALQNTSVPFIYILSKLLTKLTDNLYY